MIFRILGTSVLGMSMLFAACSPPATSSEAIVFGQALPTQLDKLQAAYSVERPSMTFESGITVSRCDSYLKALQNSEVLAVTSERRIESEYQSCEALERLLSEGRRGTAVTVAESPEFDDLANRLCQRLDLTTFSHSLRPQMIDGMRTVKDVLKSPTDKEGKACLIKDDSMRFELRPVVQFHAGDMNDQYLIVWLTDEITSGSYVDHQSLLVKMNEEDHWRAIDTWPRPL